jgi:site-specific DNA-methyltransferase (adenine-specific)
MEFMKTIPDKHFDLVVADPPYGIGATVTIGKGDTRKGFPRPQKWDIKEWDNQRPNEIFFKELLRISNNQIISGGNYFADMLPASRCWIIWDKVQRVNQADAEILWTSFKTSIRIFQYHASYLMGFQNPNRFHPTEKPVKLYEWILQNYAKAGDKIFDPMFGSGSSRIACHKHGFEWTGCELDKHYFDLQEKRFKEYESKMVLFPNSLTQ